MARSPRAFCLLLCITAVVGCAERKPSNLKHPVAALTAAEEALQNNDSFSEELVAAILAIETDNIDTLVRLANTSHSMGQTIYGEEQSNTALQLYLKAAQAMQKAENSGEKLREDELEIRGPIYYDQACAYSLLGKPEKALEPLRQAVAAGYDDIDKFDQDTDLDAVRILPEYAEFHAEAVKVLREKIANKMKQFESYPLEFDLTDLDGKPLVLSEMKGKVVVLDFWATWCGPCLMVMPHLNKIYDEHKANGLEVIGLDYEGEGDHDDIARSVKRVLADKNIHYPCAIGDAATEAQIPNFDSIPTMVFIDRSGKVRFQLSGAHSRAYMLAIIEPLLAEPVAE